MKINVNQLHKKFHIVVGGMMQLQVFSSLTILIYENNTAGNILFTQPREWNFGLL